MVKKVHIRINAIVLPESCHVNFELNQVLLIILSQPAKNENHLAKLHFDSSSLWFI